MFTLNVNDALTANRTTCRHSPEEPSPIAHSEDGPTHCRIVTAPLHRCSAGLDPHMAVVAAVVGVDVVPLVAVVEEAAEEELVAEESHFCYWGSNWSVVAVLLADRVSPHSRDGTAEDLGTARPSAVTRE